MTLSELKTVLDASGLPVAYGYFREEEAPELPCVTFELAYTSNFMADRIVYQPVQNVDIFLYTRFKDEASEARIETALAQAKIFWDKTETYLPEQRAYQIIYEVKI